MILTITNPSFARIVCAAVLLVGVWTSAPARGDTVTVVASQDNTLYESSGGTLSNGLGDYLFAGRTGQVPGLSIRRALVMFDLTTAVPADSTITSATLSLRMSRSNQAVTENVAIHRLLNSWGESTSNASGQEGEGVPAAIGDATWLHRFYNTTFWSTPGGDFAPTSSASTPVGTQTTFYSWSSSQVAADVQGWLDNSASNAGWIVIGNESTIETAKRFDSRNNTDSTRRPRLVINFAPLASWANDANGDWSIGTNWTTGAAPNGIDAKAKLGPVITSQRDVRLDVPVTLGGLKFECDFYYLVNGPQTLTFNVNSGVASMEVISGNHGVTAPVHFAKDTTISVAPDTASLRLAGDLSAGAGVTLTKSGPGRLDVKHLRGHAVVLESGLTRILSNGTSAATSRVTQLNIAGGTTPTARLDITDNAIVIDYEITSPISTVAAQIKSARAGGDWSGNGIFSSMANASQFAVGYSEASALSAVPAIFGSVTDPAVLIRYTRYGDSNLDGVVNLADFNNLAANFGLSGRFWNEGDFNYDSVINLSDFNLLAANFGLSASGRDAPTSADWAALAASVPEPSVLVFAGVAASAALSRRRRR